jgi:hypothetical protein
MTIDTNRKKTGVEIAAGIALLTWSSSPLLNALPFGLAWTGDRV